MARLQIDEQTANAVNSIATAMEHEWAIVEDYIARSLCFTRDRLETAPNKEYEAGVALGLRHLFELRRKAINTTELKETGPRSVDKVIIGEQEYTRYTQPRDVE